MQCFHPVFLKVGPVPCGQCLSCRINRRRQWVTRMMLESQMHEHNCFLTLTYAPEFLPAGGTLVPKDWTDFLKRFRERLRGEGIFIRFFAVGEYGDRSQRPHYHAILFGYPGCVHGVSRYRLRQMNCCKWCDLVRDCWPAGFVELRPFIRERAQYCAHYTTKKMTSKHDVRLNGRHPEFSRQSRRPGIGAPALYFLRQALESDKGQLLVSSTGDVQVFFSGQRPYPLGRYLRDKLRQEVPYEKEEMALARFCVKLSRMRDDFESFGSDSYKEFYAAEVAARKQKELNISARFNVQQSVKGEI